MRRSFDLRHLAVPALLILAGACAGVPKPPEGSPPEVMNRYAWELLERGSTYNARQVFEELLFTAPGSAVIDSVHFGLAEAHFKEGNYYQARSEYETVTSSFPRSSLVDQAAFNAALCYWEQSLSYKLDQQETRQALQAFQSFLLDYPASELAEEASRYVRRARDKLARKELYQARTYMRLGTERDYEAAVLILSQLIRRYQESGWVDEAVLELGKCYFELDRTDQARQAFAALVSDFPESETAEKAREWLRRIGPPAP
ncbi:MAG: outer membrane protein assembly factor BamD [bacterium]